MKKINKAWIVLLILGAALCIGMCLFMDDVSASISVYEQQNPYVGNQLDAVSFAISSTTAGNTQGIFFRTNCSIEVNKVSIYMSAIFGSWAGKVQKIGLRGLDANGDVLNTWLGATGRGWVNITPVATTCIMGNLQEKVTLLDDTVYFLAINDSSRVVSGSVYFVLVCTSNGIGSIKARPSSGFLEPFDMYGVKTSLTWDKSKGTMMGWAVMNSTSGLIMGDGYVSSAASTVYRDNPKKQLFNVSADVLVDGLDIIAKQVASTYSANDSLHLDVCYYSNNTVLTRGVIPSTMTMKMLATGHCRWLKTIFSPVWLRAGIPYYIKVWTRATSDRCYTVYIMNSILGNGTFMSCTYGGNSCEGSSTNNGSTWTMFANRDMQFRFHLGIGAGLVVSDMSSGVTGSITYSWSPFTGQHGEWWVTDTHTGIPCGSSSGSENLSVINPNPGNGTHDTNFLKKDASGLTTSLDIIMKDMNMSEYGLHEYYNPTGNDTYPVVTDIIGQGFIVGTTGENISFMFDYARISFNTVFPGKNFTFYIVGEIPDGFGGFVPNLSDVKTAVNNMSSTLFHVGWNIIDFPDVTLLKGGHYYIMIKDYNWSLLSEFLVDTTLVFLGQNNGYPTGNVVWYVGWMGWSNIVSRDMLFEIWGHPPEYSHCINVSWLTNETLDGHWYEYANITVVENSTVTVPFPNASGVGKYWWKAETESNHTLYLNTSVFWFQTVASGGGGSVSSHKRELDYLILGTMGCIPMLLILRRKKKNII